MAHEFSDFAINSVEDMPGFDNVDGLNNIGKFFDYAIEKSIRVQAIRNNKYFVSPEEERNIVTSDYLDS